MAVVFTLALVIYPKVGYEAGMQGLRVCWEIIIPSLLPFLSSRSCFWAWAWFAVSGSSSNR
ncbi:sporulation integral membrane protein YlbJ [Alicyclobacillus acidocaldarius subsp. acidocaldarius Tc-4-1]|uniref:Sporulation integral membrane protein YlbJ n=2 Tax=Alicyclobacillus acidocaldarius TaxID=405212 RepID=F8IJX3_ALIAT|nr:sporulation integral membrane protein YlbJ [Alicyclobacillus acidocaldarius subsp. acidocaldarius Tc-4-1]